MEIVMKLNSKVREANLKREFEIGQRNRNPDSDIEGHFKGMSYVGKALWNLYQFDAQKRAKALENKSIQRMMIEFFRASEKWATDRGYRWEDVMVRDAAITDNGVLLIGLCAKPGAEKI